MIAPTFKSSENYQTIKSNLPEKNWRLSFQGQKKNSQTKKNQPGDFEDGQIVHRNFSKKELCLLKQFFGRKKRMYIAGNDHGHPEGYLDPTQFVIYTLNNSLHQKTA